MLCGAFFFKIWYDSWDAVAENAQHEPQDPWFLMAVIAPAATQSVDPTVTDLS